MISTKVGGEHSGRNKRSNGDSSYFFYQEPEYPRDCKEVNDQCEGSSSESGVYLIKPDGANEPFHVYCNNSIDGGGWTVFQHRVDGSVEFYRDWDEYRDGFGFLNREFWLGNDKISLLTNQKDYMLRIDLNNANGDRYFARYDLFRISDEETKNRLVGLGEYDSSSTTAYDRMAYHRNQTFSTLNRDNDRRSNYHLAQYCHGAWWYGTHCYDSYYDCNLNGLYTAGKCWTGKFWEEQKKHWRLETFIILLHFVFTISTTFYMNLLQKVTTSSKDAHCNYEYSSYFFYQEPEYPRDCKEVYDQCEGSSSESGIYLIKPDGANEPFQVYCNNSIDGGGWTVFQRRVDGSVEFYRDWYDYRDGFGFLNNEFWLGNDKISLLTNQKDYMLRIDLNNVNGDPYFARYDLFRISDEETKYRLVGLGEYDSSSTTVKHGAVVLETYQLG
ncbi:uncharacterized protein [Apostichopus japonicus]|uniref:uncharacterized protein n=1 Tax=Stichopus japonicus TaxID=307972 RepID=UPI003AB50089